MKYYINNWKRYIYLFFDSETVSMRQTEMYVEGFRAKLEKDTRYKGIRIVSFSLKEL